MKTNENNGLSYSALFKILLVFVFAVGIDSGCGTNSNKPPSSLKNTDSFDLSFISPGRNATRIRLDTTVLGTFTQDLDPGTVTSSSFLVSDSTGSVVAGTRTVTGQNATFTPSANLQPNMTYSVSVSKSIRDLNGVSLYSNYTWTFSTVPTSDMVAPSVLSVSPKPDETNIPINVPITITFSEPMDPATINQSSFYVRTYSGWARISGTINYSGTTAVFTPTSPLAFGTTYEIVVETSATDLGGNPLDFSWDTTFTTIASGSHLLFNYYKTFEIGSQTEAIAIGDVNNDGRPDVVITTSFYFDPDNDYCLFVFLQNNAGSFDPPIKYRTKGDYFHQPKSVAIADMNGDGKNDVIIGNEGGSIEVMLQDSSGNLLSGVTYSTANSYKIRTADLNNDGRTDVVGIGYANDAAEVFLQSPQGTLVSAQTYSVGHEGDDDLDVGDVNNDGLVDVVVMSQNSAAYNFSILPQLLDGSLGSPQGYDVYYGLDGHSFVDGIAVGDINGDGRNDVVVTSENNVPYAYVAVFLQNSTGTLAPPVIYDSYDLPAAVEIADVNGDGKKDLVVVHDGTSIGIYLQASNGSLLPEELYAMSPGSAINKQGIAVGDINGDGKNDVALADGQSLVVLYHQ